VGRGPDRVQVVALHYPARIMALLANPAAKHQPAVGHGGEGHPVRARTCPGEGVGKGPVQVHPRRQPQPLVRERVGEDGLAQVADVGIDVATAGQVGHPGEIRQGVDDGPALAEHQGVQVYGHHQYRGIWHRRPSHSREMPGGSCCRELAPHHQRNEYTTRTFAGGRPRDKNAGRVRREAASFGCDPKSGSGESHRTWGPRRKGSAVQFGTALAKVIALAKVSVRGF